MKRTVLLAALFAVSMVAVNAQESYKPEAGKLSVELGFSPFSSDAISLQGGEFKVIYSLNENFGIRLGLGITSAGGSYDAGETGAALDKQSVKGTMFSITPGITYSFVGTNKLTPYVGAEIAFATEFLKMHQEKTVSSANWERNTSSSVTGGDIPRQFGFALFTGFNYYFAKNLYIGAEAGFGIASTSYKYATDEYTNQPAVPARKDKTKASTIGFYANPSLRLGWSF